ncbi:MAG: RNA pseudouridine synthase [Opitutaceae bacterium]|nr:RNA pseudouridine synthase [Opitutaceae bacterium]
MEKQTYTVPSGVMLVRADKSLAYSFPEHSRVAFHRAFDAGLVTMNGRPIKRNRNVVGGDVIEFSMPEIISSEIKAVDIPLEILFEDEHFLAINKAPGMVVHPGAGTAEDTLVHALLAHCAGQLSGVGGVERPGIVHRLDRETSGVIVAAKTDEAHRGLSAQFAARTTHKEYLTLVMGKPELLSGIIDRPIGRNPGQRHKMAVVQDEKKGKHARTDWEVGETFEELSTLVRCTIHTGRTHQIRVHMKSLGHILLGDTVYGWKPIPKMTLQPERVMLHAEHLVLKHPISGEEMDLRAPVPDDFEAVLEGLRGVTRSQKRAVQ